MGFMGFKAHARGSHFARSSHTPSCVTSNKIGWTVAQAIKFMNTTYARVNEALSKL